MAAKAVSVVEPSTNGTASAPTTIRIQDIRRRFIHVTLVGDTPLISNRWSEKAKAQMRDKQMKAPKQAKLAKVPQADFEGTIYRLPDGRPGFPAIAFKAAAVGACSHLDGVKKVIARGAFHIFEELIPIESDEPVMREDMVRIAMGVADLRYRAEFRNWRVELPIWYNASVIEPGQIINMFNVAGFATGVGEWRPEKDGRNGMFHVEGVRE